MHDATCFAASWVGQVIFTAITGDVGVVLIGIGLLTSYSMAFVMGILGSYCDTTRDMAAYRASLDEIIRYQKLM